MYQPCPLVRAAPARTRARRRGPRRCARRLPSNRRRRDSGIERIKLAFAGAPRMQASAGRERPGPRAPRDRLSAGRSENTASTDCGSTSRGRSCHHVEQRPKARRRSSRQRSRVPRASLRASRVSCRWPGLPGQVARGPGAPAKPDRVRFELAGHALPAVLRVRAAPSSRTPALAAKRAPRSRRRSALHLRTRPTSPARPAPPACGARMRAP